MITFYWYNVVAIVFGLFWLSWILYLWHKGAKPNNAYSGLYYFIMRLIGYIVGLLFLAFWGGIFWW